jgi:hypothetical protein
MHFTRAIVASPRKAGVLFAGTEYGLYVSMNDGKSWEPLQLNLPVTPVTDLLIRDNNLIVGTQGRSIYVLDDLSFIENYQASNVASSKVFPVANAYRVPPQMGGRRSRGVRTGIPANVGTNPPKGVVVNYWLKDVNDSTTVQIDILDENKKLVRHFSSKETGKDKSGIVVENGLQQFTWNLYHKEIEKPSEDLILWNGSTSPVLAAPGKYFAKVSIDKDSVVSPFEIMADPNFKVANSDLKAQEQFLLEVAGSFNTVMKALKGIKEMRGQVQVLQKKTKDTSFQKQSEAVLANLKTVEEALHQTKAKSGQDVLNFPIRLDDKLAGVFESAAAGYVAPTKQVKEAYIELKALTDEQLKKYETIKKEGVKALNEAVHKLMIPIIGN